jgi:hypothetical protein
VGAFTIPAPPAASAGTLEPGINSLPHPIMFTGWTCTTCHASSSGGKNSNGYDHNSTLIEKRCNACHEAGSDLVSTVWNGATSQGAGAGNTRPFTLTSLNISYNNGATITPSAVLGAQNHFYAIDCYECHSTTGLGGGDCRASQTNRFPDGGSQTIYAPDGGCLGQTLGTVENATSGSTYTQQWTFPHRENNMTQPSTCNVCHGSSDAGYAGIPKAG